MLTDLQIEKLTAPPKRREIPDGKIGGLYLVVQPSGAKSWALRYRVGGAPKKFTIGPYPAITLATARKRAQKALAQVVDSVDPSAQKKAERAAQKAAHAPTDRVEQVVDAFVARHLLVKAKPSWAKEAERLLRVEIVAKWGKRRLSEITARDVDRLLTEIAERAPITANRTFGVFRRLCNWAAAPKIGLIASSPCAGVDAPSEERSRDRVLSDDELRLVWGAFETIGWPFGAMGKLLLLTGARRGEVAAMEWREIDLDARLWSLPASRTKNKHAHALPLSDAAIAVLKDLPRIHAGKSAGGKPQSPYVFSTVGARPVSGFSHAKAAIDAAILAALQARAAANGADPKEAKAPDAWTIHDVRRSVATNLQKLGVKLEVTEAILNHVSGSRAGIVGIYQRHEFADEKRAALDAWARALDAIVMGNAAANVIPFTVNH